MSRQRAAGPEVLSFERIAAGPDDTRRLGRSFGELAPDGAVLLLAGPLGAGKTTFAQGVAEGCGVEGPVGSPTFNLILHHTGARPFVHADLYRLQSPAELETLDLEEVLSPPGLACIEWPALVTELVEPPFATVELVPEGSGRRITARLAGSGWRSLLPVLEADG